MTQGGRGCLIVLHAEAGLHETGEMNVSVCDMQRWELQNVREKVHVTNSSGA